MGSGSAGEGEGVIGRDVQYSGCNGRETDRDGRIYISKLQGCFKHYIKCGIHVPVTITSCVAM